MSELFFEFTYSQKYGDNFKISSKSKIFSCNAGYADKYLNELIASQPQDGNIVQIILNEEIPENIVKAVGDAYKHDDEGYALEIKSDEIRLCAMSKRGFIYAVSTLKQLIAADKVAEGIIYDRPDVAIRGYKVYTPGADNIDTFKKTIDKLIYYKYNTVMIEVGGAMEYDRHPEINEKWKEFCTEVSISPEATHKIEHGYWWKKNSIHADNGCGGCISKAQMRELVDYCREREMEVIPEVPSLSHSDYIVMAHPDLNERTDDPYPDTYCPSNPKSYEILFDIIDEVAEVFEPKYMNIGHDELYTVGICDKCKDKDPVELYVGDITKINNYLKSKGIRAMMWCEKLLYKVAKYDDIYCVEGAWAKPWHGIPDMGRTAGKIPTDVILLNWYWSLNSFGPNEKIIDNGYEDEKKLVDYGYDILYGNFDGIRLSNYRKRISQVKGGFVSNWGSLEEEYMQRNGQNFDLTVTAYTFWSHNYDNDFKENLLNKTKSEMKNWYYDNLGRDLIKIRHTTDFDKKSYVFYDGVFIVPDDWIIGNYIVEYSDGIKIKLPVNFLYNIGCKTYNPNEMMSYKLYGSGTPVKYKNETWYETAYKNPYPDKEISNIYYESIKDAKVDFEII